ncbi:hypothetical protein E2C01_017286 [Portunus trituberculatus]|uniref:Uncharacterized protein n=1 Tax=Portunus trituberculatus TaxID=210409 RepID=A0A5B7DS38_PORTR|nr:hypothetical protein [Portunus trituberculatus]
MNPTSSTHDSRVSYAMSDDLHSYLPSKGAVLNANTQFSTTLTSRQAKKPVCPPMQQDIGTTTLIYGSPSAAAASCDSLGLDCRLGGNRDEKGVSTPEEESMVSRRRGVLRFFSSHTPYCRSLNLLKPVVKTRPVSPQYTALHALDPS